MLNCPYLSIVTDSRIVLRENKSVLDSGEAQYIFFLSVIEVHFWSKVFKAFLVLNYFESRYDTINFAIR